jgi:hypothetical protein
VRVDLTNHRLATQRNAFSPHESLDSPHR